MPDSSIASTGSRTVSAPALTRNQTLGRHEFRCERCGYGAVACIAPRRCPMCGNSAWSVLPLTTRRCIERIEVRLQLEPHEETLEHQVEGIGVE